MRHVRFAWWMNKATDTQNMKYLLFFQSNSGYGNAPQYYVCAYIACLLFMCVVWTEFLCII